MLIIIINSALAIPICTIITQNIHFLASLWYCLSSLAAVNILTVGCLDLFPFPSGWRGLPLSLHRWRAECV